MNGIICYEGKLPKNDVLILAKVGALLSFNTDKRIFEWQKIDDPSSYAAELGVDLSEITIRESDSSAAAAAMNRGYYIQDVGMGIVFYKAPNWIETPGIKKTWVDVNRYLPPFETPVLVVYHNSCRSEGRITYHTAYRSWDLEEERYYWLTVWDNDDLEPNDGCSEILAWMPIEEYKI